MSGRYIPQDDIDEASDAVRHGVSLETLAGRMRTTESHLRMLLGLRDRSSVPTSDAADESYLRAGCRLHAKL